jgi:hypothetical protein
LQRHSAQHLQAAVVDQLLRLDGVGALQANDDGDFDVADVLVGIHDALCYAVAAHDAAEDVHQDGLHCGVLQDDAEGFLHAGGVGRTTDVEEVGGFATAELDDVHGGHGEAGTVHHAAHVAVELHVVEASFTGFHFDGILLGLVAHLGVVRVAVEGVAVQAHLGIHGDHLVVAGLEAPG